MTELDPVDSLEWYDRKADHVLYKAFVGVDLISLDAFYSQRMIPDCVDWVVRDNPPELILSYVEMMSERLEDQEMYQEEVDGVREAFSSEDGEEMKTSLESLLKAIYQL